MTDLSVTKTPEFKALPQWMSKAHWYNLKHEWETGASRACTACASCASTAI